MRAWNGEYGGSDPAAAYREFVGSGVAEPPPSSFREAFGGSVLGSDAFVGRSRGLARPALRAASRPPEARLVKLAGGHFVGRFLTAHRERLRTVAARLGVRHVVNLGACPAR